MKKICILLVLAMMLTMTACANNAETTAPVAELTIQDLAYAETSSIDDFWMSGTITSGANLERLECAGTAKSDALGISVSIDDDVFYFPEEVTTYEFADLTDFFVAYMDELCDQYASVARLMSEDETLTMELHATVYDTNGSREAANITVIVHNDSGVQAQGLAVKNFESSESGTLEQLQISGTIESDVPLVKLTGYGEAVSTALAITVSDMSDPYYFDEGVTSIDMTAIKDYILEQMENIYDLFGDVVTQESEVTIDYVWECTDEAGSTVCFEIHYVVTNE